MNSSRALLAIIGLVVVLGASNYTILERQKVVDEGQPLLLRLRPVDPRSLMQGDYMVLRYAEDSFPPRAVRDKLPQRGTFVVALDENNVATFVDVYDGTAPGEDQALLQYKLAGTAGRIKLGAESFFFQEGHRAVYADATYGVLHVDTAGKSVLVGLADENGQTIKPPAYSSEDATPSSTNR